jgi:hypothetical protein
MVRYRSTRTRHAALVSVACDGILPDSTRRRIARALDYPKWLIKNGANLVIFPEGTRSTSRKMAKFRHGVSILATELNVPVVPIYLVGLNKLRPKGSRNITPGPGGAHFQPAIRLTAGTSGAGRDEDDLRRAEFGARARAATRAGGRGLQLATLNAPVG